MSSVALKTQTTSTPAQRRLALATHTLRALLQAHRTRRHLDLDALCSVLGVEAEDVPAQDGVRARRLRREDVRDAVRQLDVEGFVDATRMRLTLTGFALATSMAERRLLPLHRVH
jgi:hypothetical protein